MIDTAKGKRDGKRDEKRDGKWSGEPGEEWLTLWRSELAALAVDREWGESWAAMTGLWARAAQVAAEATAQAAAHEPAGGAGADAPAGPPPPAAASDPRLHEIAQLNRRVAELEERLAALGGRPAPPLRPARPARGRRPA